MASLEPGLPDVPQSPQSLKQVDLSNGTEQGINALLFMLTDSSHDIEISGDRARQVEKPTGIIDRIVRFVYKSFGRRHQTVAAFAKHYLRKYAVTLENPDRLKEMTPEQKFSYAQKYRMLEEAFIHFLGLKNASEVTYEPLDFSLGKLVLGKEDVVSKQAPKAQQKAEALEQLSQTSRMSTLAPGRTLSLTEKLRQEAREEKGDCLIHCANGKQLSFHSHILQSVPFFSNLFQFRDGQREKERRSGEGETKRGVFESGAIQRVIDLSEFSSDTVAMALDYFYCGHLEMNPPSPEKLLEIATFAKFVHSEELYQYCLQELNKCLSSEHHLILPLICFYGSFSNKVPEIEDVLMEKLSLWSHLYAEDASVFALLEVYRDQLQAYFLANDSNPSHICALIAIKRAFPTSSLSNLIDGKEELEKLEALAKQNHAAALYWLATHPQIEGERRENLLQQAAMEGNVLAQFSRGEILATIEKWHRFGDYYLACAYRDGIRVAQNSELAFKHFLAAAEGGHLKSQLQVIEIYAKKSLDLERNQNIKEAENERLSMVKWVNQLVEEGTPDILFQLQTLRSRLNPGHWYSEKTIRELDLIAAKCESSVESQLAMVRFELNLSTNESYGRALEWYKKASLSANKHPNPYYRKSCASILNKIIAQRGYYNFGTPTTLVQLNDGAPENFYTLVDLLNNPESTKFVAVNPSKKEIFCYCRNYIHSDSTSIALFAKQFLDSQGNEMLKRMKSGEMSPEEFFSMIEAYQSLQFALISFVERNSLDIVIKPPNFAEIFRFPHLFAQATSAKAKTAASMPPAKPLSVPAASLTSMMLSTSPVLEKLRTAAEAGQGDIRILCKPTEEEGLDEPAAVELRAHSVILNKLPFFGSLMKKEKESKELLDGAETKEIAIDWSTYSSEVVKNALDFFYLNRFKTQLKKEELLDLLTFANGIQNEALKNYCEVELLKLLRTDSNALFDAIAYEGSKDPSHRVVTITNFLMKEFQFQIINGGISLPQMEKNLKKIQMILKEKSPSCVEARCAISVLYPSLQPGLISTEELDKELNELVSQGSSSAMYLSAIRSKDNEKAKILFEKAAEQGYLPAYVRCPGQFKKDPGLSIAIYQQALESGFLYAYEALGNVSWSGVEGMFSSNPTQARRFYEEGARRGCSTCKYHLAICYEGGHGGEKNLKKAAELLLEATREVDAFFETVSDTSTTILKTLRRFAAYHKNGAEGIPQNMNVAIKLLTLAAEQGEQEAQFELAECLSPDDSHAPFANFGLGILWYEKAAKQGHRGAQAALKKLRPERPTVI